MSAAGRCGDHGGVGRSGKPCGNHPVRHAQDIAGRCHHHGDAGREAIRQGRALEYAQREAEKQPGTALYAARTAYAKAKKRADSAAKDLVIAKEKLEWTRRLWRLGRRL